MVAVTFLDDHEVRTGRSLPDDPECNALLQEFREATGEDWIIRVRRFPVRQTLWARLSRRPPEIFAMYTLYADCHGEWQIINLVTPKGGSVFHGSSQSREDIMNFMMGYLNGIQHATSKARPA
jgi:hypothetical protein